MVTSDSVTESLWEVDDPSLSVLSPLTPSSGHDVYETTGRDVGGSSGVDVITVRHCRRVGYTVGERRRGGFFYSRKCTRTRRDVYGVARVTLVQTKSVCEVTKKRSKRSDGRNEDPPSGGVTGTI